MVSEVAGGAAESVTGIATFTFKLSPAYAIINPDGYVENGVGLVKGLAYGATHPVDFAKAIVDWNTWAESPGRALGHLLPAVALAIVSAGAGAGAGAEATESAPALRAVGKALEGAEAAGVTPSEKALLAAEEVASSGGLFAPPVKPPADGDPFSRPPSASSKQSSNTPETSAWKAATTQHEEPNSGKPFRNTYRRRRRSSKGPIAGVPSCSSSTKRRG